MKNMFKITFISFLLIVLPFSSSIYTSNQTASAHDFQEESGLFLHDVPALPIERIRTFQYYVNGMVYALKNKWASIDYQISQDFLSTSKIKSQNPTTLTSTSTTITSGLLPSVGKSYTYEPSFQGPEKKTYVATKNPYFDDAVDLLEDTYIGYTYIESSTSFEFGVANSDVFYFSLDYPMQAKTTIHDTDYGVEINDYTNVTVTSTTETVQTKAGTFKNVVVLTYPNGSTLFIAKGHGIIKIIDYEGNTSTELINVQYL